jgi:hypothetical protein
MNRSTIKKTGISAFVILFILVGAGTAYTWFFGEADDVKTTTAVSTPAFDPNPIKPSKVSPNAQQSAAIEALNTPIKPGENTLITVKTLPKSICTISALYGKAENHDSGLTPKHANDFGIASWSWTIGADTPNGSWPIEITCAIDDKSAFVRGYQVVER